MCIVTMHHTGVPMSRHATPCVGFLAGTTFIIMFDDNHRLTLRKYFFGNLILCMGLIAHEHTVSLSLSLSHAYSLSLSHTHTLSLSDTHTHTLSFFLSLTHTHTLSLSLSHTHTHTLGPVFSGGRGGGGRGRRRGRE